MELPRDLQDALDAAVDGTPPKDIVRAGAALSGRYRTSYGQNSGPALQSSLDVRAYIAYRLPATYAAIRAVFRELRERRPGFHPASLLDLGGGPGTAAWAAVDTWPDLQRVTVIERDREMIRIGKDLADRATSAALREASWQHGDITATPNVAAADLTVAAYVLGELAEAGRGEAVRNLWERSLDGCVIVEPGTPRGYELVRDAGQFLAATGAHVNAPFPADWQCLDGPDDWCHFAARVPRTRLLRQVKGGTLSYEDEKFSYVAASRVEGLPIAARVIRHPQVRSGHVRLVLCTPAGVKHVVVARSNRETFRRARDLRWGSAIPIEDTGLYGLECDHSRGGTLR